MLWNTLEGSTWKEAGHVRWLSKTCWLLLLANHITLSAHYPPHVFHYLPPKLLHVTTHTSGKKVYVAKPSWPRKITWAEKIITHNRNLCLSPHACFISPTQQFTQRIRSQASARSAYGHCSYHATINDNQQHGCMYVL